MNFSGRGGDMRPNELIRQAESRGRQTLTEAESKDFLSGYGIPVVREYVAGDPESAAERAKDLGFPVVVKGLGAKLTHKTERGLVRLNLTDRDQVVRAARDIGQSAGEDLEGYLVQPQVHGRREFVAGLFHDSQFGPVVMFGLGGIFTEAIDDVVFRLAPVGEVQARSMVREIKSRKLLDAFRGEAPVNEETLVRVLMGLSSLAMENPRVAEVDINPLLVTLEGEVCAVDALVVLGRGEVSTGMRPPIDPADVGAIFYPGSVAFVGASAQFRKWGHLLFTNVVAGDYEGDVYLVTPKGGTMAGRPVYRSVVDIPGDVDLAVVTIPATRVLDLLPELEAKKIKYAVLITSGFAETGAEGKRLESELVERARKAGVLLLGPNTMGLCNPYRKFYCLGSHVRPKAGPTAFVSQSGNMGVQLLSFADQQGIGIRAFAGSGNEAMLTIEDILDAFSVDHLTSTVLLYVESVKNGRRFFESASNVSRQKPVVVLKGGRTEAGSRAAASHTGALASNTRVFNAACRQAGIVLAEQPMDLLDLSASFSSLPLPKGRRVALMTLGGGWGVVTSDLCDQYGLSLPPLSEDLIARIDQWLPPFWSRANPVDLVGESDPGIPVKVMDALMAWDGCDAVINLGILGRKHGLKQLIASSRKADPDMDIEMMENLFNMLEQWEDDYVIHLVRLMEKYEKPVLGVSLTTRGDDKTVIDVDDGRYKGIFFPSPERAVKVLGEMCAYYDWLVSEGER
jgi:acyl-CoA synthetase (NDP forming)